MIRTPWRNEVLRQKQTMSFYIITDPSWLLSEDVNYKWKSYLWPVNYGRRLLKREKAWEYFLTTMSLLTSFKLIWLNISDGFIDGSMLFQCFGVKLQIVDNFYSIQSSPNFGSQVSYLCHQHIIVCYSGHNMKFYKQCKIMPVAGIYSPFFQCVKFKHSWL